MRLYPGTLKAMADNPEPNFATAYFNAEKMNREREESRADAEYKRGTLEYQKALMQKMLDDVEVKRKKTADDAAVAALASEIYGMEDGEAKTAKIQEYIGKGGDLKKLDLPEAAKPGQDPERIKLAQIASDPARSAEERRAAKEGLKKLNHIKPESVDKPDRVQVLTEIVEDPDSSEMERTYARRMLEKLVTVTGTTEFDPAAKGREERGFTGTDADLQKANMLITSTEGSLALLGEALRNVDTAAQGTGISGGVEDSIMGYVEQLPGKKWIAPVVREAAGIDSPEAAKKWQQRFKKLTTQQIPTFTGEKGNRISDIELKMTEAIAGMIGWNVSKEKLQSSLRSLTSLQLQLREEVRHYTGEAPTWDLTEAKGKAELFRYLKTFNLDRDTILDMYSELSAQQREFRGLR